MSENRVEHSPETVLTPYPVTTWAEIEDAVQIMRDTGDLRYKASRSLRKERSLHNTLTRNATLKA